MRRIALLAAVAAVLCSCCLEGILPRVINGDSISADFNYDVPAFTAVKSLGSLDVIFTQGTQSVTLTCDSNLEEYYDIYVDGGVLFASVKRGAILRPHTDNVLTVSSPSLSAVSLTGSGDCCLKGAVECTGDLRLFVTGSSDLKADGPLSCDDLVIRTSGSGDISLGGSVSCDDLEARTTGSGDMRFFLLTAGSAVFASSGSGNIESDIAAGSITMTFSGSGDGDFFCKDAGHIDVRISGSSDVRLSGTARSLSSKVSGSGRVNSSHLHLAGE